MNLKLTPEYNEETINGETPRDYGENYTMSNMLKWAEEELRYAGYDVNDPEDGPNRWLAEGTLELLKVFSEQGHSGMSAPYAVALFEKLAMWKPIVPLTGEDDEWAEAYDNVGTQQNKRNGAVFRDAGGHT